ncbi:MAG: hypothetical protein ACM357_00620 [Gemmatimonadota bacterium]
MRFPLPAAVFFLCLSLASPLDAQRRIEQTILSDTLPRVSVSVDPALGYLGRIDLDVGGRAMAEQHLFGELRDGRLARAVIVHFEHFLPGNAHTFEYPRLRMARLGRHEFLHQTWPLPDWELFRLPEMVRFLSSRGVTAGTDWIVSRYVRVVSDDRKHEFIIFYMEAGASLPMPVADLRPGGRARGEWPAIEADLIQRAAAAVDVRD